MVVSSGAAILNSWRVNIALTGLIKAQIFESSVMLGCGMVIALLYGLFNRHLKVYMKSHLVAGIYEVVFWIFAAALASQFLYYCAYGALSPHVICSFLCGVFLWNRLFYATISLGGVNVQTKEKKKQGV